MPEKIIEKIKSNLSKELKLCFLSAIIIGLVAHIYKITNWLPNWDSLVFRYDNQNMLAMGRWFLPIACGFSSFYDLPLLSGLLSILFHTIGAMVIVKMFDVKKSVTAVLIGAMVVSFPTVTSVLTYNYVADGYALSFLLASLAAYFLTKEKPNYILSVIFIALSVGIYQAYVTVTIMLLLFYLINETIKPTSKFKDILIKATKYLVSGAVGMGLYYLVLTVLLKITNTALLDYQGLNDAASLSSLDLLGSLYIIKESFFSFFFDFSNGIDLFHVINCIILIATVVFYITDIIKNKTSILKILTLIVLAILLPIGANILSFINSSIDYHNLMKMGFCVFYLFFILGYEKVDFKNDKINIAKLWTILLVSFVLIFNQVIIANVAYHKLNMAYEKSYGILVRVADRIEQTEGANECDSILVLGALENSKEYSALIPPEITGTTDGLIIRADDEIVGQSVFCSAINDYCDKDYKFLAGDVKQALLQKIDINSLKNWPDKNSIMVVDNVIVIKLGD